MHLLVNHEKFSWICRALKRPYSLGHSHSGTDDSGTDRLKQWHLSVMTVLDIYILVLLLLSSLKVTDRDILTSEHIVGEF